jgi:hypothetical protein
MLGYYVVFDEEDEHKIKEFDSIWDIEKYLNEYNIEPKLIVYGHRFKTVPKEIITKIEVKPWSD